jgi:hypothetical protein
MPDNKEYKFVYMAALYFIATRPTDPMNCKIMDIFPTQLVENIHSILVSPGTIRNSGLYRDLTYNIFALHIIKIATTKWKYVQIDNDKNYAPNVTQLLGCDTVHISHYVRHNIETIRTLCSYDRCNLFYRFLKPELYGSKSNLYVAVTDLTESYEVDIASWNMVDEYCRREEINETIERITPTVCNFVTALRLYSQSIGILSCNFPFRTITPNIAKTIFNMTTEEIVNDRRILRIISDSVRQFREDTTLDPDFHGTTLPNTDESGSSNVDAEQDKNSSTVSRPTKKTRARK